MKIHYQLHPLSAEEKQFCYYILMDEMDRQSWYGIYISLITKKEEYLCLQ